MGRAAKFSISIPDKEFKELEAFRRRKGISRSKMILEAIRIWKEGREKEKLIKTYVDGYKQIPERLNDIEVWEKASLSVFSHEEW